MYTTLIRLSIHKKESILWFTNSLYLSTSWHASFQIEWWYWHQHHLLFQYSIWSEVDPKLWLNLLQVPIKNKSFRMCTKNNTNFNLQIKNLFYMLFKEKENILPALWEMVCHRPFPPHHPLDPANQHEQTPLASECPRKVGFQ